MQWLTMGKVFFGYAKPVPINPFLMKNPKRDILWVGLAGPLTNLILGTLAGLTIRLYLDQIIMIPKSLAHPLMICCVINLWLAIVNFVPVPPLDGSRIVTGLLPNRAIPTWISLEHVGFFILILLIATGFFDHVLGPLLDRLVLWITGLK
jgi:Zn-dependent protease